MAATTEQSRDQAVYHELGVRAQIRAILVLGGEYNPNSPYSGEAAKRIAELGQEAAATLVFEGGKIPSSREDVARYRSKNA